jgi:hypothetical protein
MAKETTSSVRGKRRREGVGVDGRGEKRTKGYVKKKGKKIQNLFRLTHFASC